MYIVVAASVIGAGMTINSAMGDPLGLGPDTSAADQANQSATDANAAAGKAQLQLAQISREQWDQYKKAYQDYGAPALKSVAAEAMQPSDQAVKDAQGRANADVTGSFDIARKADAARLQSFGINPGSPSYQSGQGSWGIAEAGTKAGALTTAARQAREDSYNKRLGIYGLVSGMEGPATAGITNSANTAGNNANAANRNAYLQGSQYRTDLQAQGAGISSLVPAAKSIGTVAQKWFGSDPITAGNNAGMDTSGWTVGADSWNGANAYAKGGRVIEGKAKRVFGPHMKSYARGGGVGRQGLEMMGKDDMGVPSDVSSLNQPIDGVGTETSDSIPAVVDGQEPAALSTNEFVMNAEVQKMSGEEILEAINNAGLAKRQGAGIEPREEQGEPPPQMRSFARGGRVNRRACVGL